MQEDIRGKVGTGSVLSLLAKGPQDTFLYDEESSYYYPSHKQHTNFAVYQERYQFGRTGQKYFGNEVKLALDPKHMGDLLSNMYLKFRLPRLRLQSTGSSNTLSMTASSNSYGAGNVVSIETTTRLPQSTSSDYWSVGPSFSGQPLYGLTLVDNSASNELELYDYSNTGTGTLITNISVANTAAQCYSNVYIFGYDPSTQQANIYLYTSWGTVPITPTPAPFPGGSGGGGGPGYAISEKTLYNVSLSSPTFEAIANTQTFFDAQANVATDVNYIESVRGIYTDKIGRAIIKQVKFAVDTNTIETLDTDWYNIRDDIFLNDEERYCIKYMINAGQNEGELPTSNRRSGPINLYVPLDLFFCRKHSTSFAGGDTEQSTRPYLPLCAMHNNKIYLSIQFNKQEFFTNSIYDIEDGNDLSIQSSIVAEQITLSDAERHYLVHNPQKLIIESVLRQPKEFVTLNSQVKKFLTPNIPVKAMFWFLRDTAYENDNDSTHFLNRFNYSTTSNTSIPRQALFPAMTKNDIYLNLNPI